MRIRVVVHPDKCIGAGHCVVSAPAVFSQNEDDGVVILLNENPSEAERQAVKEAARLCPTSAIDVIEEPDG